MPVLVAALGHPDPILRAQALIGLGRLGAVARPVESLVEARCRDVDPVIRAAAAHALRLVRQAR
jgi:HEAT repeat protein